MQGYNGNGEVGDGTTTNRATPALVHFDGWWASVATGDHHTCGIRSGGQLWCWGLNSAGQVGDGSAATPPMPTLVSSSSAWSTLSLGTASSCATNVSGSLHCWGDNAYGQLGDNSTTARLAPTAVATGLAWTMVAVGAQAVCGIAGAPAAPPPVAGLPPAPPLFATPNCWGTNGAGQFGNGSTDGTRLVPTGSTTMVWEVMSLSDTSVCAIQRSVMALYCWGRDASRWGGLGEGSGTTHFTPLEVAGGGAWTSVFAASGWGCGIRANGSLSCWGRNHFGAVGDNTTTDRLAPVLVSGSATWASLPPRGYGGFYSCGIQADASLWCWVRWQYAVG